MVPQNNNNNNTNNNNGKYYLPKNLCVTKLTFKKEQYRLTL